jgi:membrane-associated protease RseP (regulator of RpoE activity)
MGLRCDGCTREEWNGTVLWTFRAPPVVAGIEQGSLAEQIGLRPGAVLTTVDGLDVTTRPGAERLALIGTGRPATLSWTYAGMTHFATVPGGQVTGGSSSRATPTMTETVGNATVEIRGGSARWSRDPNTGEVRILADSLIITIRPPTRPPTP